MDRHSSDEPEATNRKVRKPKKSTKDGCIKEILKLQNKLLSVHKPAYLFSFQTKYGHMQFGSSHVVSKFKSEFQNDSSWKEAFEDDKEEMIEGIQTHELDENEYDDARANLLPKKLPACLHLMNYEELWTLITTETIKQHWAKGGKYKCVKFGNLEFEPTFWLGETWPWTEVTEHPNNLKKSAYTGPGIMTDFLKKVVIRREGREPGNNQLKMLLRGKKMILLMMAMTIIIAMFT